jgi:hypothetical protein
LGVNFSGVVKGRFCWGFCKKRRAEHGFLVVILWWSDGELWWVGGRNLELKKRATFSRFIFG